LIGIGDLAIECIVGIASLIPYRVGNRENISDSIVSSGGGIILSIDDFGLPIERIKVVISTIAQRISYGGAIANFIVGVGSFMSECIGGGNEITDSIIASGLSFTDGIGYRDLTIDGNLISRKS
jgi:hypothetical protein